MPLNHIGVFAFVILLEIAKISWHGKWRHWQIASIQLCSCLFIWALLGVRLKLLFAFGSVSCLATVLSFLVLMNQPNPLFKGKKTDGFHVLSFLSSWPIELSAGYIMLIASPISTIIASIVTGLITKTIWMSKTFRPDHWSKSNWER